ncbi:MAG TPA: hypothetical protein VGL43_04020, partial [Casimicrobiaceae bacterium]
DVAMAPSDASISDAGAEAERSAMHVYVAMITRERSRTEWALVSVTRTVMPDVAPAQAIDDALQGWRTGSRARSGQGTVMLAWREPRPAQ